MNSAVYVFEEVNKHLKSKQTGDQLGGGPGLQARGQDPGAAGGVGQEERQGVRLSARRIPADLQYTGANVGWNRLQGGSKYNFSSSTELPKLIA